MSKSSANLLTVSLEYPEHLVNPRNNMADFIYEDSFIEEWVECGLSVDNDLWLLESFLTTFPETGRVIQGTGGLRKVRWSLPQGGKRGGVRIIYQWIPEIFIFYVYIVYRKSEKDDLQSAVRAELKTLAEENRSRLLTVYGHD